MRAPDDSASPGPVPGGPGPAHAPDPAPDPAAVLRTAWQQHSEHVTVPSLAGLRARSARRAARRNALATCSGALVVTLAALGIGSAMLGNDRSDPPSPIASGGSPSGSAGEGAGPLSGLDPDAPAGAARPDSALEALRQYENRRSVPFPQAMAPVRGMGDLTRTDALVAGASDIVIASDGMTASLGSAAMVTIAAPEETIKGAGGRLRLRLTGSQQLSGAPGGRYLIFARDGAAQAIYAISGTHAAQVQPVRTSAPAQVRLDAVRALAALRAGRSLPASSGTAGLPLDLDTACGVRGFALGGYWFARDGGALTADSGAGGSAPAGWDAPVHSGLVTFAAGGTTATFTDASGHRETFTRQDSAPGQSGCP